MMRLILLRRDHVSRSAAVGGGLALGTSLERKDGDGGERMSWHQEQKHQHRTYRHQRQQHRSPPFQSSAASPRPSTAPCLLRPRRRRNGREQAVQEGRVEMEGSCRSGFGVLGLLTWPVPLQASAFGPQGFLCLLVITVPFLQSIVAPFLQALSPCPPYIPPLLLR